jgi:hypothetical protein
MGGTCRMYGSRKKLKYNLGQITFMEEITWKTLA